MIQILLQTNDLVVVLKQSGLLSVPSRLGKDDARPVLGLLLQSQLGMQIFPAHRLDFEVSGLMVFALNPKAQSVLNSAFENKKISKLYEAVTDSAVGKFPSGEWLRWESLLVKGKKRTFEADYGKASLTEALLESTSKDQSWWKLKPITGRSHQLRYEMYKHGFPIHGDLLYGGRSLDIANTILLHASQLSHQDEALLKLGLPETLYVAPSFQRSERS